MGDEPVAPQEQKIRYPIGVFFINLNVFCECFGYYGMRTVLSIYMRDRIGFSEHTATIVFHSYICLACFFPLLGAIIADSYIGKFKTILYLSIVYDCGVSLLAMSSVEALDLIPYITCPVSLFLMAIGGGGKNSVVSTFGADQFILPQQQKHMDRFFFFFYFSVNLGSCFSVLLSPIMRKLTCLGQDHCFPLAFGISAMLIVSAFVIFIIGKPFYIIVPHESSVITKWLKCICYALRKKCGATERASHWLDRSTDEFGEEFVKDVKSTLSLLLLFSPIPLFWGLFTQQGSTWTFQATRLNGETGSIVILPDQLQVLNPVLILIFIPVVTYGVYPLLNKMHILNTPLKKISCGGFLGAAAFFVAGYLDLNLEGNDQLPAPGSVHIRVYNLLDNSVMISGEPFMKKIKFGPLDYHRESVKLAGENEVKFEITLGNGTSFEHKTKILGSIFCYLTVERFSCHDDDMEKHENGYTKLRVLVNQLGKESNLTFKHDTDENLFVVTPSDIEFVLIQEYTTITVENYKKRFKIHMGAVYTLLITADGKEIKETKMFELVKHSDLHIFWQFPQYFIITLGEIFLSVTAIEFVYVEAPKSMRCFVSAFWLLTITFGNIIVVILESLHISKKGSTKLFVFGGLMVGCMCIFTFLATRYKYVKKAAAEQE